jgi:hypothetical protein
MARSAWYALLFVTVAGWCLAGLMALVLVSRIGWLGILILGMVVLMIALRVELDADSPAMSVALLRRQQEQRFEGTAESRLATFAERLERNRWLYIVRTIGIALSLLGLTMFSLHQF